MEYNFPEIEKKWQLRWIADKTYKVTEDTSKPKYYVLDMFPYPSGAGLHVGHPLGYIASDIYSRYKTLKGFNVLHPMGYDAFGLPAEQYAIQTGQHPAITTENNIKRYGEQLQILGFSYDPDREICTSDPAYYKWTQWAFIKMFSSYYCFDEQQARPIEELVDCFKQQGSVGLNVACGEEMIFTADEWNAKSEKEQQEILLNYRIAYKGDMMVNWSPDLGTVLANDEVSEGLSIRGGFPVVQKVMSQWCLRVSAYAQRLLDGLDTIEWTDSLKEMQRNWIGRSEGAEMTFHLASRSSQHLTPSPSPQERGKDSSSVYRSQFHTTNAESWKKLIVLVRQLRSNQTEAEEVLWQALRGRKTGYKIRRQHIVNGFIADFICLEKQTIIEVDGGIHDTKEQKERDEARTQILNENGYSVIRFSNDEILANPENIVSRIIDYLDNKQIVESFPLSCGEGLGERFSNGLLVFTTRPDTIFGVTFMVLAPESEYVQQLVTAEQKAEVDKYIEAVKRRTERERIADRKVTGVFTGSYAINPLSGTEIPIWISDYVLAGYGTGAIMAVPGHDSRDYAFAKHFNLPIIPLIEGCDISEESFDAKEGIMMNSGFLNGLTVKEAIEKTKQYIAENKLGRVKVNYRLRDAIFSRQRYWGEPFPVYYKNDIPHMLDISDLPLELPEVDKFLPTETGEPPLGRATKWAWDEQNKKVVETAKIDNKTIFPLELCTMPGFAGSSAYFLRYMDPHNDKALVAKEADAYWKNVDLYVGGTEHATGHLVYSRFWNKFLFDLGVASMDEPFQKLVNQGMIQGRSNFVYRVKGTNKYVSHGLKDEYDTTEIHVDVNIVENDVLDIERWRAWSPEYKEAELILENGKYICGWAVEKMSKSYYNVVNPDDVVKKYGADTLRMYEMFLGPLEQAKPWDTKGIDGVHRFLRKFWRLFHDDKNVLNISEEKANDKELKVLHKTIKKVQQDIETFSFNTAVSAFMICVNELGDLKCNKREILEPLTVLLSSFAPHICEELWEMLGHKQSVAKANFPELNEKYLVEDTFEYPVSFNGKMRFKKALPLSLAAAEVEKEVLADENTTRWLEGKTPKKIIVVPGKIVNIVM